MSVNKVFLLGNVGRDPEVRHFENGSTASFPLATSERFKDRNGNLQDRTEWHNIVVGGNQAKVIEDYVKKGSQLFIEGKIRTRKYQQDGVDKYITEIVVERFQLLGRPKAQDQSGGANTTSSSATITDTQDPYSANNVGDFQSADDDLPF